MLSKLIYASIENRSFSVEELSELAQVSSNYNQQQGITGYLFYRYGVFFQFLEGAALPLSKLMSSIEKDKRHSIIKQFSLSPSKDREFPNWGMRLFDLRALSMNDIDGELEELMLRLRDFPHLEEPDEKKVIDLLQRIAKREQE